MTTIGWLSLIIGIFIICYGIKRTSSVSNKNEDEHRNKTESKGFILIGPIPIVWGFGRKGWYIAGIIGVTILILWIILFS